MKIFPSLRTSSARAGSLKAARLFSAAVLLAALMACRPASAQELTLVTNPPPRGTFYSLTLLQPPFPFNPFPELAVYSTGTGAYVYDDSQVDYVALRMQIASEAGSLQFSSSSVLLGGGGAQTMSLNSPPPPGGGGGGAGGGGTNGAYAAPGLKLTIPVLTNGLVLASLMEADTNSAYDIFERFAFASNRPWARIAGAEIGVTNFAFTKVSPTNAFYLAADTADSDFDGLSDAFETLVSKSNPLAPDTDGDGLPDGLEDSNTNSVPDRFDYARLTRAVLFASKTNAFEGGQNGELTILLPTPAPTNGTPITLHLGGNTDAGYDYRLTAAGGAALSNVVYLNAGQMSATVLVVASNNTVQESRPRRVQAALLQSPNFPLGTEPATVTLVDNDKAVLSIIATDAVASEPVGTNLNPGVFTLVREGNLNVPLTVGLFGFPSGSASQNDYTYPFEAVYFPTGVNHYSLMITPTADGLFEGDEDLIMTLPPETAFDVNPLRASARIVIKDRTLPVVSLEGTDLIATEYGMKAATVTIRRTGPTTLPLDVRWAIGGSANGGYSTNFASDYEALTNVYTIPAGASTKVVTIRPLADAHVEPVETITLTLRGGTNYAIGTSNSVSVLLDDDHAPQYQAAVLRSGSIHGSRAAIIELRRLGRASGAVNVPFEVYANTNQRSYSYVATGDVGPGSPLTNVLFASYSPVARLNLTGTISFPGVVERVEVVFPALGTNRHPIWYGSSSNIVDIAITQTNAIEGTSQRATILLSRTPVIGMVETTVYFTLTGPATPSGTNGADLSLPRNFSLTLPAGVAQVQTNITALADTNAEGWESVLIHPDYLRPSPTLDYHAPYLIFLGDNIPDPAANGGTDTDGDGMSDRWEVTHGLDPFSALDRQLDPDRDGLLNIEENLIDSNPLQADTDGDTVNDYTEHAQGSNPLYALDSGLPPAPGGALPLRIRLGDHSGSRSEQWELKLGPFRYQSPGPGIVEEETMRLPRGTNYPITLRHMFSTLTPPDYDYTAKIFPEPTNAPAGYFIEDAQNLLGVHDNDSNYVTKTATLIVPRLEVTWESVPNSGILDTNPAIGGGLRYYPDQQSPTDSTDRRKLFVRVKTTPPLPGRIIKLRALDVDDPTKIADDISLIIDANDLFGIEAGNDNRSAAPAGQLFETTVTLDVLGEAVTFFTVGLQPGDNYRVAALLDTPGASNHLAQLQVANEVLPMFVPSGTNQISDFVGALSPMLTVWRKLHLEFDSMAAPPASGPETLPIPAVVSRIQPNWPASGQSFVTVFFTNTVGALEGLNEFERGKLEVPGLTTFRVLGSELKVTPGGRTYVYTTIEGVLSATNVGRSVNLYDDDEQFLWNDPMYPSLLNLPPSLPVTSTHLTQLVPLLRSAYRPAYIEIVDGNAAGWNSVLTVPFRRNKAALELNLIGQQVSYFDQGNLELKGKDRPQFWAHSVVLGYQPNPAEDGDNDNEHALEGGTPKGRFIDGNQHQSLGYSVVFMESARDAGIGRRGLNEATNSFTMNDLRQSYWSRLGGQTAHEVAHAPGRQSEGGDHDEDNLMRTGGDYHPGVAAREEQRFSPSTIKRVRSTPRWSN